MKNLVLVGGGDGGDEFRVKSIKKKKYTLISPPILKILILLYFISTISTISTLPYLSHFKVEMKKIFHLHSSPPRSSSHLRA